MSETPAVELVERRHVSKGVRLFRGVVAFAAVVTVCMVGYLHVRLQTHEREHVALEALWGTHVEDATQHVLRIDDTVARLDYLESVLFGEVLAKLKQQQAAIQPQPRLSLWQQIRDRERLLQLELARQKLEQRLEQLEDAK